MRWPTDDDDGCTGQQSEQGAEHHLVAVYEAVQGVAPLHATDWRNSCREEAVWKSQCFYLLQMTERILQVWLIFEQQYKKLLNKQTQKK